MIVFKKNFVLNVEIKFVILLTLRIISRVHYIASVHGRK